MVGELRPAYSKEELEGALPVHHAHPVLYRFLEEKYVDEFLESGRLMISTIRRCRELEDQRRMDKNESTYSYELKWLDKSDILSARVGDNAFVLCCSLTQAAIHSRSKSFCIELHHWNDLAVEIGKQLRAQGFTIGEIFAGPCNYAIKSRQIDMSPMRSSEIRSDNGIVESRKVDSIMAGVGRELFYTTKDLDFVKEQEYRIMWLSNAEVPIDPVFVNISSPKRYGSKVCAIGETYEG